MTEQELPDWDRIVERHAQRVFRVALRILGSVQDAEDVSQDVFVEAFKSFRHGPVQSWIGGKEVAGGIELWNVEQGTLIRSMSDDKPTTFVKYSADGKYVASASNWASVKLWDASSGELVRILAGVTRADFSPDGTLLACSSSATKQDQTVGKVNLYNLQTGELIRSLTTEQAGTASYLLSVAFSPDGATLAAADWNGLVTLWTVATGSEDKTLRLLKLTSAGK